MPSPHSHLQSHSECQSQSQDTPTPQAQDEKNKEYSRIVRLRENKRRSRARQKEYLQQLERRCREYEQSHVQATVEMQVAARKVAEENRLLRLLLKKMGANEGMVNTWLESQGATGGGEGLIGEHQEEEDEGTEKLTTSLPLRSRSRSGAVVHQGMNRGEQLCEAREHERPLGRGSVAGFTAGTMEQRASSADCPTPTSILDQTLPELNTPMTQAPSPHMPQARSPLDPPLNMQLGEDALSSYTLDTFSTSAVTPATTVTLTPHGIMDTAHANNYFTDTTSPSSSSRGSTTLPSNASPVYHQPPPPQEQSPPRKPLVYFRMDPTMEMYNLYPMPTVAVIPWLVPTAPIYQQGVMHQTGGVQGVHNPVGAMGGGGTGMDGGNGPQGNHSYSNEYQYPQQ